MSRGSFSGMGHFTGALVAFGVLLSAGSAHAFDLGVGLIGVAGGNFQNKPDSKPGDVINPGFGGGTLGGGLMVDGRILDGLLGLELDLIRSSDKGSGDVTINGYKFNVTIGQAAWHLPVLLKLAIPSPIVAPVFVLGPEFVFPSDGDAKVDGPIPVNNIFCKADSYVMVTGGAGVEIKLPLPLLDLRIPVGLRGSYNPGLSNKAADRGTVDLATNKITYNSEWKFAVQFTAGAAIYF